MRYFPSVRLLLAALILTVALPLRVQAQARDIKPQPDKVYTNGPSKFQFPPTVATFRRMPTYTQYNPEESDIGVGYNDLLNGIAITVFVYPIAAQPPNNKLEGHFETCKSEVLGRHAGSKLTSNAKIQITPGGKKQEGLHATFSCTELFAGKTQPVKSELYLFTHNTAFVLYRVTFPAANQTAAEPAVKAFIEGLEWP